MSRDALRGRVVLITGASSGIGAATALLCGAAGMRVALSARRGDLLQEIAAGVREAGGEALAVPADVREPEQVEAMARAVRDGLGSPDILVANAGIGYTNRMDTITEEELLDTVGVNLLGVMRCVRAVLPEMIRRRSGHVITVSSVASGFAMPRAAVYAATKAGVHRFTEGLRREVVRHGIQVTDVLPGVIDTPMTARARGVPKAPVEVAARAIVAAMRRPRRAVVTPGWYRLVLAANRACPGLVDRAITRRDDGES